MDNGVWIFKRKYIVSCTFNLKKRFFYVLLESVTATRLVPERKVLDFAHARQLVCYVQAAVPVGKRKPVRIRYTIIENNIDGNV